jgi:iron complex outermembrane receptor protein
MANLTIDAYKIEVDDRIYKTGDIACPAIDVNDPNDPCFQIDTVAYFTNALDVEHTGVDIIFTMTNEWMDSWSTDWTLAGNWNDVDVVAQKFVQTPTGPVQPVSDSTVEDIENNFPNERAVLTMNNNVGENFTILLRANYYGSHYDERGTIAGSLLDSDDNPVFDDDGNPTRVSRSWNIGSTIFIDLDLGWQITDNWRVNAGGVNIFDEFIDEVSNAPPPNCTGCPALYDNRVSVGLQYPRRSAANYEGGYWYLNGTFTF